jgi:hypothetical protein
MRTISCAAKSFWMTKQILRKNAFKDLGDTILICITLPIVFKRSTISNDRKPKMSKVSLLFNNIIHFSSKKNITSINWNNFVDNLLHAKGNQKKKCERV